MDMEYLSPRSLLEVLTLLGTWKGKARLVSGCTNMLPDVRAKAIEPAALIDLSHLKGFSLTKEEKRRVRVGALTTIAELASSKVIQKTAPILAEAARQLGNPLVRNRATIGGNIADASPAADTAVPLLALEATIVTDRHGKKGREIPIDQFFIGPNKTVLKPDEIIKEVFFPKPDPRAGWAYRKLGLRNAMAISVVSVAVLLEMDGEMCKKARISLGAVAPTPMRAYKTETSLTGQPITGGLVKACCEEIEGEVKPISDSRASADYRRSMVSVLFRRCVEQILSERKS
jgi:carbon-monoxide dehydrogenase medium subunit